MEAGGEGRETYSSEPLDDNWEWDLFRPTAPGQPALYKRGRCYHHIRVNQVGDDGSLLRTCTACGEVNG